jgi:copper chaperone CopZ
MIKFITFKVNDMHCESCPKLIKMDLDEAVGVVSVKAILETKTVVVEYNDALTDIDKLIEVIKNSGYTAFPLA